jgi:hypothetical protein
MRGDSQKKPGDVSAIIGRMIERATLYIAGGFGYRNVMESLLRI